MMKKLIMSTIIAACLAVCAAVWPQSEAVEKRPASIPTPAVYAPEATVAKLKTEVEVTPLVETIAPRIEAPQGIPTEPAATPIEPPTTHVAQPTAESEVAQEADHEPASAPTVINPRPGDMVYVDGFGWLEC